MSDIIKKGLAHCAAEACKGCPYDPLDKNGDCTCLPALQADALAYIETLEERLKEAEARHGQK